MENIQTLYQQGQHAYQCEYYQNARNNFNQALQQTNDIADENKRSTCQELQYDLNLNISKTYCCQRESTQALQYYDQALNIANKISDKIRFARCNYQYGGIKIMQNSFDNAMQDLKYSLELILQVDSDGNVDADDTYHTMGKIFLHRTELTQAKEMFDKSLLIRERKVSNCNSKIAQLYYDIADWYSAKKKFSNAITMYEKSLKILLTTVGEKSLDVAKTYCSIGRINKFYMKQCYDAQSEFEKALKLELDIVGESSADVAHTYYYSAYTTEKKIMTVAYLRASKPLTFI